MKIFTNLIFKMIAQKLDGHKAKIGGWASILLGVVGIIGNMWPDLGLLMMDMDTACGYIVAGWTVIGYGGKMDKIKNSMTGIAVDVGKIEATPCPPVEVNCNESK